MFWLAEHVQQIAIELERQRFDRIQIHCWSKCGSAPLSPGQLGYLGGIAIMQDHVTALAIVIFIGPPLEKESIIITKMAPPAINQSMLIPLNPGEAWVSGDEALRTRRC